MNRRNLLKTIGPGILFASTAIGVSHLVQSTRAGATYGFALVGIVLLALLFKYPFFEFGSRYANAKGESIIDGYKRMGKPMLWLYFLITLGSMFFVMAAVGLVTAGFLDNLFQVNNVRATVVVLMILCTVILLVGRYGLLDSLIKVIACVLLITTVVAFLLALSHGPIEKVTNFQKPKIWDDVGIAFIVALVGWMPTAVDLSAWNSLWTIERIKQTGYKPTMKETLFDFNFSYLITAFLALCFLSLGALLMFGGEVALEAKSHLFAGQVIELYTKTIGGWSEFIIASAAFSIMFSTSIAVLDGYARSLERTIELLFLNKGNWADVMHEEFQKQLGGQRKVYNLSLIVVALGGLLLILAFMGKPSFKILVDTATTISFMIAPIIAIANFRLVMNYLSPENQPPKWLQILSWLGIIFLTGFAIYFLIFRFF